MGNFNQMEITETDRLVMKQMGISEEDFRKYNQLPGMAAMKQQAGQNEWLEMKSLQAEDVKVEIVHMADGQDAPNEFLIFPYGQVTGIDMEPFTVDRQSIESCRMFHKALGRDIVIDYEHQSMNGQPAPAAGWIQEFYDGGGLACKVTWTTKASEFIRNREYRYFSPVVTLEKESRRLLTVFNMAITNNPRGYNLTSLAMKAMPILSNSNPDREIELHVMKLMGISEEDFRRYNHPVGMTAI